MQGIKQKIILDLRKIIKDLTGQDITPNLEHPKDERHGDYSTNIAMTLFKVSKGEKVSKVSKGEPEWRTPMDLANKIASSYQRLASSYVEKVEAVKPGFINFWLSEKYLLENIKTVLEQKEKFGSKAEDPNKKIVVEYSSPNIAKPFTIGHLRSTIIGDAIANLLEANGWKVFRDNHLGDWGTQFGKQIYAIKTWGNEEKIKKSQNPVKELVALYVKFHEEADKNPELEDRGREWFKKLEDGDKEARRLWNKCVEWSWSVFEEIYRKLNVPSGNNAVFENEGCGFGESFFEDKMGGIINELDQKKLLKESEGAKLVFFPKDPSTSSGQDKYPPLMIIKKDGATLYATRDLATDKFRLGKYGKDVIVVNEVGVEQSLYFKQLYELENMLGWYKEGQRIHKRHGHYRFKDEKMSTRKGNVIWLEDLLIMAIDKAHDLAMRVGVSEYEGGSRIKSEHIVGGKSKRDEITRQVAIGAIKWNDLKRSSNLDIVFDWDEILNMEGNSGPYLQYTFARTQSVLRKASINVMPNSFRHLERTEILKQVQDDRKNMELEEVLLLRAVHRFPEIVEEAAGSFAPNIICNYLFDLAQKFNLFYQKHKILSPVRDSSPDELVQNDMVRDFRLSLTQAVGQVIRNGLYLLGIQATERM